jgi:hypothetical protein
VRLSWVHEVVGLVRGAGIGDAGAGRGIEARRCWQAASVGSVVVVLLLLLVEEVVAEAYSPSRVGISPLELATLRPGVGTSSCRGRQSNHCVARVAIHASSVEHHSLIMILAPEHSRSSHRRLRSVVLVLAVMVAGAVLLRMLLLLVVLLLGGCWEARTSRALLLPPVENVRVQTGPV